MVEVKGITARLVVGAKGNTVVDKGKVTTVAGKDSSLADNMVVPRDMRPVHEDNTVVTMPPLPMVEEEAHLRMAVEKEGGISSRMIAVVVAHRRTGEEGEGGINSETIVAVVAHIKGVEVVATKVEEEGVEAVVEEVVVAVEAPISQGYNLVSPT